MDLSEKMDSRANAEFILGVQRPLASNSLRYPAVRACVRGCGIKSLFLSLKRKAARMDWVTFVLRQFVTLISLDIAYVLVYVNI